MPIAVGPFVDARVIAVASGKGGAGASTVAALLAASAAGDGMDTLLVEARAPATLHIALGCDTPVDAAVVLPRLRLASAPADLPGPADAAARRAGARRLRDSFAGYECIIVDVGTGLDAVLAARDVAAASVVVVTAPDRVALAASHAFIKAAAAHWPAARIAAIANRTDATAGERALQVLADGVHRFLDIALDVVGCMPDEPAFAGENVAPASLLTLPHDAPLRRAASAARVRIRPNDPRILGVVS